MVCRVFPGVKGAFVPPPSAPSGVSEMLQDAGLQPRGEPRGEEQLPALAAYDSPCEHQAAARPSSGGDGG